MGQGIYYCCRCQIRLRSKEFEQGAVHFNAQAYCVACAPEEARAVPPPAARTSSGKNKSTTRFPVPNPPSSSRRIPAVPETSSAPAYAVLALVGVLGLAALFWIAGSASDRPPAPPPAPPTTGATPVPPPPPVVPPVEPSTAPAPADTDLRKARDYVRANPQDFVGQAALYEKALPHDEARRELEAVRKAARERVAAELASLDPAVREAAAKEQFGRALDLIEETRRHLNAPDWPGAINQRVEAVHRQAADLLVSIRKEALEARGRGRAEQVQILQERVARWGLEPLAAELAKALAEPVPESAEAVSYAAAWEGVLRLARARDYASALADLKRAADGLKDETLRKKSADDLEVLRQASDLLQSLQQIPAKWRKGKTLSVEFLNPSGTAERVEGSISRLDAHRVELKGGGGDAVVIPFGEIRLGSLANRGALSPLETRGLDLLVALEGEPESARDQEARSIFHAAEKAFESPGSTADAVQSHATLLKDYGDTRFVRRNRPFIQARSQGGREFFLFPEDMTAGGSFKWVKNARTETCFSSDADSGPAGMKENFVDIPFSVLPGVEYRCWVYVGGCCAETFAFSYQTTDLAEPGSPSSLPAKVTLSSLKKGHSQHTGPKSPARWDWVALPLPKYSQGGAKILRILTSQEGFSVGFAFVGATKQGAPRDAEFRTQEKARLETPGARALNRSAPPPKPRSPADDQVVVWKLDTEGGKKPASVDQGTVEKAPDRPDRFCMASVHDATAGVSRFFFGEPAGMCAFSGDDVLVFEYWVDSNVTQIVFNVNNRTLGRTHASHIDKPAPGKWTRYSVRLAELGTPDVLRAGDLVGGMYLHAIGGSARKFYLDNVQIVRPRGRK